MKVNLKKITSNCQELEKLEFFKQLNIYDTINCNEYVYMKEALKNRRPIDKQRIRTCDVETTIPSLCINLVKIIDTIEGTSLEGQHLSGKKLIIVGEVSYNLIIYYKYNYYSDYCVYNIKMPFSTFIIIPKDICNKDNINLRYLIEDVSIANLGYDKSLVSITLLIQYLDKYIDDEC